MINYQHNSLVKKYLYHITQSNIPDDSFIWKPKTIGSNRCDFEPRIPRICLSTRIAGCFITLGECLSPDKNIFILKTTRPVHYYTPSKEEVLDAEITEEVWRLKPVRLKKVATLNSATIQKQDIKIFDYLKYNPGTQDVLPWQTIAKTAVNKFLFNLNP
jgi:hypothetical protein